MRDDRQSYNEALLQVHRRVSLEEGKERRGERRYTQLLPCLNNNRDKKSNAYSEGGKNAPYPGVA